MESDVTAHQALAEAERATASLWTVYPPTPWWYCPAGGAWHGALVVALGALRHPLALLAAVAALNTLLVAFVAWYTRYRGTLPRIGSAPAEFRPAIRAFRAGYAALAVAVAALYFAAGYGAAALLAFVGATAGLYAYERAYAAAAAAARERLR